MYFVSWYLHNKENDGWAYKVENKYADLDAAKKSYYGLLANYVGSSVYDSVAVMLTDSLGNQGDPNVVDVEYQRVDSTTATQKQVLWETGGSSSDFVDVTGQAASGQVVYTETNKVEWFRCCARGLNGKSAWTYAYHVNAYPYFEDHGEVCAGPRR